MQARFLRVLVLMVSLSAVTCAAWATDGLAPQVDDPHLLLWLDATDRATLTVDEQGFVSEWKSKSLRVPCTLTAQDQQRPTWVADAWAGKPAVRFDGQDDVLHNTQFARTAPAWTLLIVTCPRSNKGSGIPGGFHGFFAANDHAKPDFVSGLNVDMGGRQTDRFVCLNVESNKAGGEANLLFVGTDFGRPRVLAVCADPNQITLHAESAQQASRVSSAADTSLAEIRVGARCYLEGRETGFIHADIAEVVCYARALSSEQIQGLSQYLQEKYAVAAVTEHEPRMSLDEALAALASYQWDQSRLCLVPIDELIRQRDRPALDALELRLGALLGQGISPAAVDVICRRLAAIGTATSVPALQSLLQDQERGAAALQALQQIPAAEAGQALLDALADADLPLRVELIRALGSRREAQAAGLLLRLLQNSEPAIAAAAGEALAQIGDPQTTDAMLTAEGLSPHTLLTLAARLAAAGHHGESQRVYAHLDQVADDSIRSAVLHGRVMSEPDQATDLLLAALHGESVRLRGQAAQLLAHQCPEEVVNAVFTEFRLLSAESQTTLLGMCWSRVPESGRELALLALETESPDIRSGGLRVMTDVGSADHVVRLARIAAEDGDRQVRANAELALRHLAAVGTDDAIMDHLSLVPHKSRLVLIRVVRDRRIRGAAPVLIDVAESADVATRIEAMTALQQLGDAVVVPRLIVRLLAAETAEEQTAAERAVWLCALRRADSAEPVTPVIEMYEGASVKQRTALLPVLGRLGGPHALAIIDEAVMDPAPDLRAAAVRALANWPDATVADRLIQLARAADVPAHRIWALRGYVRVVTLPSTRPVEQTVGMLQDAWQLTVRDEERNLILQRLPAIVCRRSLDMAVGQLREPALQAQAVLSAAQLAEALLPSDPQTARGAIEKILEVTVDPDLRTRLSRHLSSGR